MSPRQYYPPLGPVRPGLASSPLPAPLPGYQAMQQAALARSIASSERYPDALRVHDAASRASQLRHLTSGARQDATRAGRLDTAAFASRRWYARWR